MEVGMLWGPWHQAQRQPQGGHCSWDNGERREGPSGLTSATPVAAGDGEPPAAAAHGLKFVF